MPVKMPLEEYSKKRNFGKTIEPQPALKTSLKTRTEEDNAGENGKNEGEKDVKSIFVIQRHDARRLHYDFRLELDGVLKSWAVPKGISKDVHDKRLAVETEDHPLDYAKFEGVIPQGSYGAGTVSIFDNGFFANITIKSGQVKPLKKAIDDGHFLIWLKGKKIEGGYAFTRLNDKKTDNKKTGKGDGAGGAGKNWLMVRMRDSEKKEYQKEIMISGKTISLTNQDKILYAGITKGDFIAYYRKNAKSILPHLQGRPISMYRFPEGVVGEEEKGFYQKNIPDYFPPWIDRAMMEESKRETTYVICNDEASLIFLANQVFVFHILGSRKDNLDYPDKMIFDLDPAKKDLPMLKKAAVSLGNFLREIGFTPYIMTTGGKGYHIAVPIMTDSTFDEVREFAGKIASVFAKSNPQELTDELRIENRKGRIFIDVNRNSKHQTAVAPYSIRARAGLPVAMPFDWKDIDNTDPQTFNIDSIIEKDAWKDMFNHKISIKKVRAKLMD